MRTIQRRPPPDRRDRGHRSTNRGPPHDGGGEPTPKVRGPTVVAGARCGRASGRPARRPPPPGGTGRRQRYATVTTSQPINAGASWSASTSGRVTDQTPTVKRRHYPHLRTVKP